MQFDPARAFPYPVLRPHVDDYVEGDMQSTITFEYADDEVELKANVKFALSVPEMILEIKEGRAEYNCIFACRDTYFRRSVGSSVPEFSVSFPAGLLRGEVVVSPYVIATKEISSYKSKWINPEFGNGPFAFAIGSPMAIEQPLSVFVDRDSFKPISSCFVLIKKEGLPENEWRVEASQDKVHIAVGPMVKEKIDVARNSKKNQALLINSLYFSAVMQCVAHLKSGEDYNDYRWANVFKQRLAEAKIDLGAHDESWIAQTLMKHPFSILNSYFFMEQGE